VVQDKLSLKMYSKKPSFWEREVFLKDIDLLIVGSGLVGLLSALELRSKFPRKKIVIFERGAIPSGASTKNAGFTCFGSLSELIADLETEPFDSVVELACRRYKGLQKLLSIVDREQIHYRECGGLEIFQEGQESLYEVCSRQLDKFNLAFQNKLGLPRVYRKANELIKSNGLVEVSNLIINQYEGQLNTGLLLFTLLEKAKDAGIIIYNGFEVSRIDDTKEGSCAILRNGWKIMAGKIIVANNAFAQHLFPEIKVKAVRNPVLITKPIKDLKLNGTFHMNEGYIYFRNVNDRVLIGGARHLSKIEETTSEFGINPLIEKHLISLLDNMILRDTAYEIDTKWSGILGVGENKNPIIKAMSKNTIIAVKMGGMGVAISSLVASEVCEMIN